MTFFVLPSSLYCSPPCMLGTFLTLRPFLSAVTALAARRHRRLAGVFLRLPHDGAWQNDTRKKRACLSRSTHNARECGMTILAHHKAHGDRASPLIICMCVARPAAPEHGLTRDNPDGIACEDTL